MVEGDPSVQVVQSYVKQKPQPGDQEGGMGLRQEKNPNLLSKREPTKLNQVHLMFIAKPSPAEEQVFSNSKLLESFELIWAR